MLKNEFQIAYRVEIFGYVIYFCTEILLRYKENSSPNSL